MTTEAVSITSLTPESAYPCEDWDAGLYLDERTAVTTMTTARRDPAQPLSAPMEVSETFLVSAQEFMAVQKERDEYRKVLALINAWRVTPGRSEERLTGLLASVGQDDGLAQALLGLARWAEAERREPGSGG